MIKINLQFFAPFFHYFVVLSHILSSFLLLIRV